MITTSLEQSKELLHLGLDRTTADMILEEYENGEWHAKEWVHKPSTALWHEIPAWSLSALKDLLPEYTETKYNSQYCIETIDHLTDWYDNPLDAAFELIMVLLEYNKIPQNKLTNERQRP